jgi:hypothetical protein
MSEARATSGADVHAYTPHGYGIDHHSPYSGHNAVSARRAQVEGYGHEAQALAGTLEDGENLMAKFDEQRRAATRRFDEIVATTARFARGDDNPQLSVKLAQLRARYEETLENFDRIQSHVRDEHDAQEGTLRKAKSEQGRFNRELPQSERREDAGGTEADGGRSR